MDTFNLIAFVFAPMVLFGGAVVWAFGRRRKKRFEEDARIPFRK